MVAPRCHARRSDALCALGLDLRGLVTCRSCDYLLGSARNPRPASLSCRHLGTRCSGDSRGTRWPSLAYGVGESWVCNTFARIGPLPSPVKVILPLFFCTLPALYTDTLDEATMLGIIIARLVVRL